MVFITRKWQLENAELELVDGKMETKEERLNEETHLMESEEVREEVTVESSQLTSCEREDSSMFVTAGNMETEEERLQQETYMMEREKETAETSQLTTSEQEETSSFVITGN